MHYLQLAKVLYPAGASATLAATATDALMDWQDINELKSFVCAFPPGTSEKRPRLERCHLCNRHDTMNCMIAML